MSDLKKLYQENQRAVVDNLLPEKEANMVHQFYYDDNFEWKYALFPDEEDGPADYQIAKLTSDDPKYELKLERAREAFLNDFSYHYKRSDYIHPILKTRFQDKEFITGLEEITGFKNNPAYSSLAIYGLQRRP